MSTYRVTLETVANLTIEVEADDPDEAYEAAFEAAPSEVCAQCSGWGREWDLELGAWDVPRGDDGKGEADWACEEIDA